MQIFHLNSSRLAKKLRHRKRGISPIIATILLIGLTMLAGAITFGTVMVVMTSKEPIVVSIDSFSDFKLTGSTYSTKYNSFGFVLDNQGKRDIGLLSTDFSLYNGSSVSAKNLLANWTISRDYMLSSLQSYYITATTNSNNESTWLSFNSTITVQVTVYATDASYNKADKSTISVSVKIGSQYVASGPIQLVNSQNTSGYAALDSNSTNNNSLGIVVLNYGNVPVNYTLDFIVSNTSLSIMTQYANPSKNLTSTIDGKLPPANGNNPSSSANIASNNQTVILTVNSPAHTTKYFVIVWLKIESTIQDTLVISC